MKLYRATITPSSNFATPLRGDTLFGQICWAIHYNGEDLQKLLENYKDKPFLVVSDAFPSAYLPKPKMPSSYLKENSDEKKKNRKKIWLRLNNLKDGEYAEAKTEREVRDCREGDDCKTSDLFMHNSINYKGFHTQKGFDPYGVEELAIIKSDVYLLIKEGSKERVKKALKLISDMGYGADTTIGKGRFSVNSFDEVDMDFNSKSYMSLSPFSPQNIKAQELFYEPFTRFGKFGGDRAFKNAFKKPLLLADTASVIHFEKKQNLPYIGSAITGISDIYRDAVHQGYSIVIPIKDIK